MNETVKLLQTDNPEFNYYLYDDAMCREFINSYFDEDTLYAYDSLVPGAYKADLWRYCILYVYGGVYLDIKYKCVNDFKISNLMNKEQYVRDYYDGIYQAFLICLPKNEILMKCIHQIIIHVKTKSYLSSSLSISGPQLINKFFTKKQIKNLNMELIMPNILLNNNPILTVYSEYKNEQLKNELKLKQDEIIFLNNEKRFLIINQCEQYSNIQMNLKTSTEKINDLQNQNEYYRLLAEKSIQKSGLLNLENERLISMFDQYKNEKEDSNKILKRNINQQSKRFELVDLTRIEDKVNII
jgi:hypothetical protein